MTENLILHITTREGWAKAVLQGELTAESLTSEGFIHCSTLAQVEATAERHFRGRDDLVLVCIDTSRLEAELRSEPATGGALFPHVYGPLNLDAVRQSLLFSPQADGSFELPEGVDTELDEPAVWVRATNQDGSPHWRHPALLVQARDDIVVIRTAAGQEVTREDAAFTSVYNARGHYWPDRWYNVIRLERPGRGLDGFYCNIASPEQFDGGSVRYTDLQLDVRVFVTEDGGLRWALLDEDEFEAARTRYEYSQALVDRCYAAVGEITALVEARQFPFDVG